MFIDKKREESEKSGSGSGSENEEEEADDVPLEQKVQFDKKVRRLTNKQLNNLVKQVLSLCPDALEDFEEGKLNINLDKLDKKSFTALELLLEENLVKKGD